MKAKQAMKRLGSIAMALTMTLALAMPAAAEPSDTVNITINDTTAVMPLADGDEETTTSSVTRTYNGYRLLDLTTSLKCTEGDGHSHNDDCYNYAYTISNENYRSILQEVVFANAEGEFWTNAGGVSPTSAADVKDEQIIAYLGTLSSDTVSGDTTTMGTIRGFAEEVYKKIDKDGNINPDKSAYNGTFADVEQGYWLIVDVTVFGEGEENNARSLIIVATKGMSDITVTPKTSVPTVEKEAQENSTGEWGESADYNIGDQVPFRLTGTVTEHYDYYETYRFIFHDTLSEGLNFEADSVEVFVGDSETPISEEHFDVVTTALDDTCSFHVVFADLKDISDVHAGSVIRVEYKATLTSDAVIGNDGNLNEVKLEFSNDPNFSGDGEPPTGETPPEKVVVFTFELDVTKVDGSSKNDATDEFSKMLSDAWFVLYRTVKNDKNKDVTKYALIDTNGKITEWSEAEPTHKADDKDVAGNLKSDANGEFKIVGLDAGTYFLKETVAPAGYNLLTEPLELVITAEVTEKDNTSDGVVELEKLTISVDKGTGVNGDITEGTVEIIVENNSGSELPETGGMGTTIFYILGGLLTVGAIVLLITKKRMSKVSDN